MHYIIARKHVTASYVTCSDIFIWSILQTFLHYVSLSHFYAVWRCRIIFFLWIFLAPTEAQEMLMFVRFKFSTPFDLIFQVVLKQSVSSHYCIIALIKLSMPKILRLVSSIDSTENLIELKNLLMNQIFIQHLHLLIRCWGCHSLLDLWINLLLQIM